MREEGEEREKVEGADDPVSRTQEQLLLSLAMRPSCTETGVSHTKVAADKEVAMARPSYHISTCHG